MDNVTNIIYNIKAIDNASATLQNVATNLNALKNIGAVTVTIKHKGTNLTAYTNKLNALIAALNGVPQNVGSNVNVTNVRNISNHTKNINQNAKSAHGWFGKWGVALGKTVRHLFSIRRLANHIADSLKQSAEYTETLHLMEVAYANASKEAYEFGQTISTTFGTSINEVYRYLSVFRQMTDAIGIADNTATKMSKSLTALGYDIASLYNISIEAAMEKLEAGIAGQTKPLRTLGMDITAQSLDNYLKETLNLSNITSKQMTQADKMILRTIVIMEQAQNATGDMAETINTFANQVKVMQGALDNFKLAVGDLIQAYFKPVVTFFAGFLIAITDIIRAFVPLEDTSGVDNLTNSLVGVEEELENIAETAGLLSFDKFNALTKKGSGSSASDITDILTGVFDEKYAKYMEDFQSAMKSIKNDANQVAQSIVKWVFPDAVFDDAGNLIKDINGINNGLGRVNELLTIAWTIIKAVVAIYLVKKLGSLTTMLQTAALQMKLLSMETRGMTLSAKSLTSALEAMSGLWGFIFISLVMTLIEKWDKMNTATKVVTVAFTVLFGALYLYSSGMAVAIAKTLYFAGAAIGNAIKSLITFTANILAQHVPALLKFAGTIGGLSIGIGALAGGLTFFIMSMDKMSTTAKVLIPIIATLAAVFVGLAVAKAAAAAGIGAPVMAGITAAALTAGIVLAAGTAIAVAAYADGGYPKTGQLFIANEAGAELVGDIGGKTAVANNDMIIQGIENAAYRGFLRAIGDSGAATSRGGSSQPVVLKVNGKEFARAVAPDMADEFSRRNIRIK